MRRSFDAMNRQLETFSTKVRKTVSAEQRALRAMRRSSLPQSIDRIQEILD